MSGSLGRGRGKVGIQLAIRRSMTGNWDQLLVVGRGSEEGVVVRVLVEAVHVAGGVRVGGRWEERRPDILAF